MSFAARKVSGDWVVTFIIRDITERKRAEDALLFTRFSLDNAIDTMACIDREARFVDVNEAFCRDSGYSREELLSMRVHDIDPDYSAEVWPEFWAKLKQSGSLTFETYHRARDGRSYPVEITANYFEYKGKEYHTGFARDITDRKKAEETLSKSEAQYRLLADNMRDQVWLMDLNLKPTYISPSVKRLRGYTLEELAQLPLDRQLTATSLQSAMEFFSIEMSKALADPTYFARPLELEWYCKDGSTLCTENTFSQVQDENGKLLSLLGVGRDITERKQMEEALKDSEAKYRLLADNTVDGVWLLDMNLKLMYCSPASEKQSGFTLQEIKEMSLEQYFTPESLKVVTEAFLEAMPKAEADPDYKDVLTLELEFYKKDGTAFWAECKFSIIRDKHGKPVSILAQARDITERRLSQEKLEKSYESIKKTLNDAIDIMVKIVEMRDPYTAGHQRKVADLATAIAREMKLEDTRIDQLRIAAVIHDIGKIYVPSDILSKPGKLSDIEFGLIKTHPQYGYDIVKDMDFPCAVAKVVLQHHERLDGSGYPNQLKGADALLEAKILAVADVVEAMASYRPYRPSLGIDKALEEISKNRGRLYDPDVVDACLSVFQKGYKLE